MYGGRAEDASIDDVVRTARRVESLGLDGLWLPNVFGVDAITALALAGRETERIELLTAVVPTYPRHPFAMAQQALTAQAAAGGRFTLGIGLSHKLVIEDMLGMSYERPVRHMREYLEVLAPLLRGEPARFEGSLYRVTGGLQVPGADSVPLLVAALGPAMLRLAGRAAQGTLTWMTGEKTLASHTVPRLREAAAAADRPSPRVAAAFPIALTSDREAARRKIARTLRIYGTLPSYRAMLDREGAETPADVALVGEAPALRDQLARLAEIGVTDFGASIVPVEPGSAERTLELLADRS